MHFTRRNIQLCLGVLWLLDGMLQFQPFMLGTGFGATVLGPAAAGQPGFVSVPIQWLMGLVLAHPVVPDAIFGTVQILIGLGLLLRPTVRVALAASVVWGLAVWYLGEGLDGIASGHAGVFTGAPGAALLYAILALAAWPARTDRTEWATEAEATSASRAHGRAFQAVASLRGGARGSDLPPRSWVVLAWTALWIGGSVLLSLPSQASAVALAGGPLALAPSNPAWLAGWDYTVAAWTIAAGNAVIVGLVVLQALIGLVALLGQWPRRIAATVGICLALADWVIGQGLGQVWSGQSNDPSTGPMFVLLGMAVLATTGRAGNSLHRKDKGPIVTRAERALCLGGSPQRSQVPFDAFGGPPLHVKSQEGHEAGRDQAHQLQLGEVGLPVQPKCGKQVDDVRHTMDDPDDVLHARMAGHL